MTTANYKTAAAKASTQGKLLLEIDLVGTGTTYAASKTFYLADDYITVSGQVYEGIVENFGGMDIEVEENEGIAKLNDYDITLINKRLQFFEGDSIFTDILDDYYFAGSVCRVYQWFQELSNKSDAELIFTGICKQPEFDVNRVKFKIQEDDSVYVDIPTTIVTKNNFSEAPAESIGLPIPIIFGKFPGDRGRTLPTPYLAPAVITNKRTREIYIADHEIKESDIETLDGIYIYHDGSGLYGPIRADNRTFDNAEGIARVTLGIPHYVSFAIPLSVKGGQYTAAATDYSNVLDYDSSTYISLAANEKAYFKPDRMPDIGAPNHLTTTSIRLVIYIDNVAGASPYGKVKYYNENYDDGNSAFSDGDNITANGEQIYYLNTNKDHKGIRDDQDDQDDAWTWDELGALEYGVTVNAGCSFRLCYAYLYLSEISFVIPSTKTPVGLDLKKATKLIKKRLTRTILKDEFANTGFFTELDEGGMKYGAWIDQNSRSNGYNEDDLIENPAYVIEAVLRDVMQVPTDNIDYASFDTAGNTTDGLLDGWKFAGAISEVQNSKDVLESLCIQCKSQLYRNPSGKFSLLVYDSSASVDYSDYKFDIDNNIRNLEINQTDYEDIISEVKINYWLDRGAGSFAKTSFIKAEKKLSGTYLNEAIDSSEYAFDVDDASKFIGVSAPGALTAALAGAGAGNLGNGDYKYKVTFVTATGETEAGTVSNTLTVADNSTDGQASLTSIPTGSQSVTSRKIYRTEVDGSTYKLLTTISDNTTTTYTDNTADGGLGATAPTTNDTGQDYIMVDREINKIESVDVSGNTLNLVNAASARTVYYDTQKVTHDDNEPIYIIKMDSDDGDGSTADTTREGNAARAIWKYNAKNTIEIDADFIKDSTTATNLRDYYFDYYSVPHWIIEFDTFLRASDLEVGKIIEFDDSVMDSYMKLAGESWSGKKFRVMNIRRTGAMDYKVKAVEL